MINDIRQKTIINSDIDIKEILKEDKNLDIFKESNNFNKQKLIVNSDEENFLNELLDALDECESFYFSVAFINYSGLQLLLDKFQELEEKNIKGKIITSTYLNFTDPKALKRIKKFRNIDLKIFEANRDVGFHTKAYIFENKNDYKIIIGSSNITQSALKSNIEWNVKIISKKENIFVKNVLGEYKTLLNSSSIVDEEFLRNYKRFI